MIYRKYRPKNFEEVIGQDIIVKILKNFIKNENKLPQGYLFSGQRGTGKTSTARIFAKALNCINIHNNNYEPCDKCINCKNINEGKFLDLIELDAASNRGIEEIKNIKENIGFKPIHGRYKVFIIDEAHMLTKEAFNALLKTLEEPPKHTIFILATTEPEKIPQTILSRVQRFDFKRIPISLMVEKLKKIAKEENIEITDGALYLIAEESDGALRDAETIFEKITLSLTDIKVINEESVENFFGKLSYNKVLDFIELIILKDFDKSINFLQKVYGEGYDILIFNKSIIKFLREILVIKIFPQWKSQLNKEFSEEIIKRLDILSQKLTLEDIKRLIKIFIEAEYSIKKDPPFIILPLELAIAEIMLNS